MIRRISSAVLAFLCVFIFPLTAQTAQSACAPKPGKNPCESCHETQCCAERRACEKDPACTAFLTCLRSGCAAPPCFTSCGTAPAAYVARFTCQMEKCNQPVCGGPVDACTLCTSTKCAAETLGCQGTAGCAEYSACKTACKKDAACLAGCKKTHAGGVAAAEKQEACLRLQCAKACS